MIGEISFLDGNKTESWNGHDDKNRYNNPIGAEILFSMLFIFEYFRIFVALQYFREKILEIFQYLLKTNLT